MTIPDETLMAYADNELDPTQRAEVEAALLADPKLAERIEQHRAFRKKLTAAYEPILMETVPNTLVAAVHSSSQPETRAAPARATITDLRRVRAARAAEARHAAASTPRPDAPRHTWGWFEWGAMAASVAIGALLAHLAMKTPNASRIGTTEAGHLVARNDLAQALSTQLASEQSPDAPVQIGLTFKSKSGDTCRTFTSNDLAGLACRQTNEWRLQLVATAARNPAGNTTPPAVLTAVNQSIRGAPLDAAGEAAARAGGWN